MAIPAVCIADTDGSHPRWGGGNMRPAVRNPVSGRQLTHQRHTGRKLERGTQHTIINGSHGGYSIEQESGACQISGGNFIAQFPCTGSNMAIAQAEMRLHGFDTAVKKFYLILRKGHILIS